MLMFIHDNSLWKINYFKTLLLSDDVIVTNLIAVYFPLEFRYNININFRQNLTKSQVGVFFFKYQS